MRPARSSPIIPIASSLLIVMCLILALYAGTANTAKKPKPQFDVELYNQIMSQTVESSDDIVAEYELQQLDWLPIVPPGPEGYLKQEAGMYVFDPSKFSAEFIKGLVPDASLGVTTYPLSVIEDVETRNRVIVNANGDIILSVPPPADYTSDWFILEMYPNLHNGSLPPEMIEFTEATFDPSRIISDFKLITIQCASTEAHPNALRWTTGKSPSIHLHREDEQCGNCNVGLSRLLHKQD